MDEAFATRPIRDGGDVPTEIDRARSRSGKSRLWMLPWILVAALAAFSLGLIANPWFEENVRSRLPGAFAMTEQTDMNVAVDQRLTDQSETIDALERRVASLEALSASETKAQPALNDEPLTGLAEQQGGVGEDRVAALETRIESVAQTQLQLSQQVDRVVAGFSGLDTRTTASLKSVADEAARAQEVLLVTAARRSIETGQSLGPLEAAIRRRFGERHPEASDAVIRLSHSRITIPTLEEAFNQLKPSLLKATENDEATDPGILDRVASALGAVVRVRGETQAGPAAPEAIISRAEQALRRGDLRSSISHITRLPARSRSVADAWLDRARVYLTGMQALSRLDAVALTPPPAAASSAIGTAAAAPEAASSTSQSTPGQALTGQAENERAPTSARSL